MMERKQGFQHVASQQPHQPTQVLHTRPHRDHPDFLLAPHRRRKQMDQRERRLDLPAQHQQGRNFEANFK